MDDSWIKLYRKILYWDWFTNSSMVHLFVYFLLKANVVDKRFEGIIVKRGQLVTSRKSIHEDTGISEQTIRTCIAKLVETGEIEVEPTKRYTVITVSKYENYNVQRSPANQPSTNHQPTTNQQLTTSKEYNNEEYNNPSSLRSEGLPGASAPAPPPKKKPANTLKETLPKRRQDFYSSLIPFLEKYDKKMIRAFFNYWSETNKSQTKMRWELQKTWETSRRLATWASKDNNFNSSNNGSNGNNSSVQERAEGYADIMRQWLAEDEQNATGEDAQ